MLPQMEEVGQRPRLGIVNRDFTFFRMGLPNFVRG